MSFRTATFSTSSDAWDSGNGWWQVESNDIEWSLEGPFRTHFVAVEGLTTGQTYDVDIRFRGGSEFKELAHGNALNSFQTIEGMIVDAIRVTPGTGSGRELMLQSVPTGFR